MKRAAAGGRGYAIVVRRLANATIGDMGDDDSDTPALHAAVAVKLFPDGHEEPIRNASVSGLTAASFKSIVAASQSRTVYTSPFHSVGGMNLQMASAGLGYAASYVMPSLLFEDVTVKGPSGDLPKPPLSSPPFSPP